MTEKCPGSDFSMVANVSFLADVKKRQVYLLHFASLYLYNLALDQRDTKMRWHKGVKIETT